MLLQFSIRVAERPPVWERGSWALVKFCMWPSFPFGIEGGMWDVIVLILDHCLSIYFEIPDEHSPPFLLRCHATFRNRRFLM